MFLAGGVEILLGFPIRNFIRFLMARGPKVCHQQLFCPLSSLFMLENAFSTFKNGTAAERVSDRLVADHDKFPSENRLIPLFSRVDFCFFMVKL